MLPTVIPTRVPFRRAALVAAACVLAVAAGTAAESGTWFDGRTVGSCLAIPADAQGMPDLAAVTPALDCAEPHTEEVVGRVPLGDTDVLPEIDMAVVDAACDAATTAYLGRPVTETPLRLLVAVPDADDWTRGAREAVCLVTGGGLVGSAAGGGLRAPGQPVAAWSEAEGPARLWLFDGGTGAPIRALTEATLPGVLSPAGWMPDGSAVIIEVALSDDDRDLILAAADGSGLFELVTAPGRQTGGAVSPDGTRVAFASNEGRPDYDILLRPLDGGDAIALTDGAGRENSPRWSPDGSRILHRRVIDARSELWLMAADGSDARRLVDLPADLYDPRWMPDGETILFSTELNGSMDIWAVGTDGSDPRPLTDHPGAEEYPTPSADGAFIVFQSDRLGTPTLWIMRSDGTEASLLVGDGPVGYPSFGPVTPEG